MKQQIAKDHLNGKNDLNGKNARSFKWQKYNKYMQKERQNCRYLDFLKQASALFECQ